MITCSFYTNFDKHFQIRAPITKMNHFLNCDKSKFIETYYVDGVFAECEQQLTVIFQFCSKCYVCCFKNLEIWWQVNSITDLCINRYKEISFNKWFDDQFNCRNAKSLIENLKAYYKPYVRSVWLVERSGCFWMAL